MNWYAAVAVQNYIHIVFSTKYREHLIHSPEEVEIHAYLWGICKCPECYPIKIGGYSDQVHVLCMRGRISIAAKRDAIHQDAGSIGLHPMLADSALSGLGAKRELPTLREGDAFWVSGLFKKDLDGLIQQPVLHVLRLRIRFLGIAFEAEKPGSIAFVDRDFQVVGGIKKR